MGFNFRNRFPFTNFHELNLDWVIEFITSAKAWWESLSPVLYTRQELHTSEQLQARQNIGAAADSELKEIASQIEDIGQGNEDAVRYTAQSGFSNLQREQACQNIGAVTFLDDQIINTTEQQHARNNIGAAAKVDVDSKVSFAATQALTTDQQRMARENIGAAPAGAVAFDRAQSLTSEQQAQARANIGVGTGSGEGTTEGAVLYNAEQNLTSGQKEQARANIGALGEGDVPTTPVLYTVQSLSIDQKEQARSNIGAASEANVPTSVVKYTSQSLSTQQQAQARANIGAAAAGEAGTTEGCVLYDQAQSLSSAEQSRARTNIGAAASSAIPTDYVKYTSQTLTDPQKIQARYNIDAPDKAVQTSATLTASGWTSSKNQVVTVQGASSDSILIVGLGLITTSNVYAAAVAAQMAIIAQGTNTITIGCFGTVPSVNIPITIVEVS